VDPMAVEAWSGRAGGREMIVVWVRVYGADVHLK
jgi:hypothetical protein